MRTGNDGQRVRREDLHGDTLPDTSVQGLEDGAIAGLDLEMCMDRLPIEEREILVMGLDYNYEEMASQLGITNGNLRVKVSRARSLLRDCLESTK